MHSVLWVSTHIHFALHIQLFQCFDAALFVSNIPYVWMYWWYAVWYVDWIYTFFSFIYLCRHFTIRFVSKVWQWRKIGRNDIHLFRLQSVSTTEHKAFLWFINATNWTWTEWKKKEEETKNRTEEIVFSEICYILQC